MADVEVSIVSLNGGEQLARCMAALPGACAGLTWQLTLVDNSAAGLNLTRCVGVDESTAVVVLRSEGRRGFGANQNLALARIVRERRARYALILNDDAEADELSVTTMVRYAEERASAGAISPAIRDAGGTLEPSIVAWPTLSGVAMGCAFASAQTRASAERGWINGACMLVRTDALAQVGLFDPRYFLYYEETDLCRRMSLAGWRLEQCADAGIVHHRHQTAMLTGSALEMDQQVLRSGYLYFRKHHGRLAARAFNWLVRGGLVARTAKVALERAAGRGSGEVPSARRLWALTMFRPSRPTRFEVEARANPEGPLPAGGLGPGYARAVSSPPSMVASGHGDARAHKVAGYESERPDLQRHIPRSARRILELGCSTGALGSALKRRQDVAILGVEIDDEYVAQARTRLDRVVASDVERFLEGPAPAEAPFDCLVAADVLEHLVDPWQALARAAHLLTPGATVIVSLPNVIYYRAVWQVLRDGRWPREDVGVFDRTHLRWFTLDDALDLLRHAGLRPTTYEPRYWAVGWRLRWRQAAAKTPLHRFLPPQYIVCAVKDDAAGGVSSGS